jgi:hypothetical protein
MRKKWRLKVYPSFRYLTEGSMKRAYEDVERFRQIYTSPRGTIHQVDVEMNEGDGWVLYESIVFPERAS